MFALRETDRTVISDLSGYAKDYGLETKVIELLDQNADFFKINKSENYHPHYFLTLDKIIRYSRDPEMLRNTLIRIADFRSSGANRIAYLYPFMFAEGNKVHVKLAIIRPPPDQEGMRDTTPMCQRAMDLTVPVLDRIINTRKLRPVKIPVKDPESLIIKAKKSLTGISDQKNTKAEVLEIYPDSLSFEHELQRLLNTAFKLKSVPISKPEEEGQSEARTISLNIAPLALPDAISDWLQYLRESNQVWQVTDSYHIVKEDDETSSEELRRHILVHKEALRKIVLPRIHRIVEQGKNAAYADAYSTFDEYVKGNQNQIDMIEEARLLINVFNQAYLGSINQTQIGFSLENIRRCMAILENMINSVGGGRDLKLEHLKKILKQQIQYNSENRKMLTFVNLSHEIEKTGDLISSEDTWLLKAIFEDLVESFAYHSRSEDMNNIKDFQDIYFVDISYLTGIVANMARLALKDNSFIRQYEVAKKIKKGLMSDFEENPLLDSKMTPNEIIEAERTIADLDKLINMGKSVTPQRKKRTVTNTRKGLIYSGIYLGFVFLLSTLINQYFIISLLFYPFLIKSFFSEVQESKSPEEKAENATEVEKIINKKINEYISKNFRSNMPGKIISKILDSNQLDILVDMSDSKKIQAFKKSIPELAAEKKPEIENRLKAAFYKNIAVVVLQDHEIPSGNYMSQRGTPFPKEIYVKKTDMASAAFRSALSGMYRRTFQALMPIETDKQRYYQRLIDILENPKEFSKLLR